MKNEEYEEQCAVIKYLELIGAKFSAIPNSTYTTSWSQKAKNKASGLRAGLPDLFIIVGKKAFFIEMKRKSGGVVSKEQKEWIKTINDAGIPAYVCAGFDEAVKVINLYK